MFPRRLPQPFLLVRTTTYFELSYFLCSFSKHLVLVTFTDRIYGLLVSPCVFPLLNLLRYGTQNSVLLYNVSWQYSLNLYQFLFKKHQLFGLAKWSDFRLPSVRWHLSRTRLITLLQLKSQPYFWTMLLELEADTLSVQLSVLSCLTTVWVISSDLLGPIKLFVLLFIYLNFHYCFHLPSCSWERFIWSSDIQFLGVTDLAGMLPE